MLKRRLQMWFFSLSEIYSVKDEKAKGRLISLTSGLMTSIYNVFITGIFYTGFLSMYGMSITDVGIISFIPNIASCTSIFSAAVLSHFKRKKPILLASKIFFYTLYIIATTVMPQFIIDPHQRVVAFAVILFVAYGVYALFSPGFTTWFYNFYPTNNDKRLRYILLNQVFSSIMSSVVMILSAVLTDAVSGSPKQNELILNFRYLAFFLVLVDVFMQACAKEYPDKENERFGLSSAFTLPFKHKKLLLCLLMSFYWNYVSYLNNGLWNYHLLNHIHFSYTIINLMSVVYTVFLVIFSPIWRRALKRYSWVKTFGIADLIWVPTEIFFFFMTSERTWMYVPLCMIQDFLAIGLNLSYANILYLNLPSENNGPYLSFYSIGCNLFAFLGLMTGTAISNITGDTPVRMLGMDLYSVQFTTLARAVMMTILGIVLIRRWKDFTPDEDIQRIEAYVHGSRQKK